MKVCRKCGNAKAASEFHADKAAPDGRVGACKLCKKAYFDAYYSANKQPIYDRTRAYLRQHHEIAAKAKSTWAKANRERENAGSRRRHAARYQSDVNYRLGFIMRGHLRRCLGGGNPEYRTEELRQRLEMNFAPGMSWNNYGEWHIDHRVPIALMMARGRTPAQINCLSNLKPLWAADNLSKGARLKA